MTGRAIALFALRGGKGMCGYGNGRLRANWSEDSSEHEPWNPNILHWQAVRSHRDTLFGLAQDNLADGRFRLDAGNESRLFSLQRRFAGQYA